MMHNTSEHFEWISALADGQLQGEEFASVLATLDGNAQARATWHAYHLVGDVLRSGESAVCRDDAGFVARLQLRLQNEPGMPRVASVTTVDAISLIAADGQSMGAAGLKHLEHMAANRSSLRWKLVAGFASVAAVAALGWNLLGFQGMAGGTAQLAKTSPVQAEVVMAGAEPGVMIRDPHLDALMAAHKQFGGTSALQMPAGFLRNATFEGPAR